MARFQITVIYCVLFCYGTPVSTARYDQNVAEILEKGSHGRELTISLPEGEHITPRSTKDTDNTHGHSQIEANVDDSNNVLQTINERLGALLAADRQYLKHLESLENRFTELEIRTQERAETVRSDLREITRSVLKLDFSNSRMGTVLDNVEAKTVSLEDGLQQMHDSILSIGNSCCNHSTSQFVLETQGKLQDVRSSFDSVLNELSTIQRNVKAVANMTGESLRQNEQFPTTKYLDAKLMELKNITLSEVSDLKKNMSKHEVALPRDCWDVLQDGQVSSGVYKIRPPAPIPGSSFDVYCNMETHGGGWTRSSNDYNVGFGNPNAEFWLGLENLYQMTSNRLYEILIELKDHNSEQTFAMYDTFTIGPLSEGYAIKTRGNYNGTAGNSMSSVGQEFSTARRQNLYECGYNQYVAGWWSDSCEFFGLNGSNLGQKLSQYQLYGGVQWNSTTYPNYSLAETRMSLRPRHRIH